ncbi:helix-turn-helix transcriptional regulator [Haloarcula rubripromontorii]|uniref:helix-turn-helix transcriptional regulator n=1 Tax=Haloarcula rubripromontorii TaxID=1705562 RepID=UPI00345B8C85
MAEVLSKRSQLFDTINSSPKSKSVLVDTLECSRSTISRGLGELRDAGLVYYEDGKWRPTNIGCLCRRAQATYLDALDDYTTVSPVISDLPPHAKLDEAMLIGATAYQAPSTTPDILFEKILGYVDGANRVRIVTPAVMLLFAEKFYDCITATDSYGVDIIIPSDALKQLRTTCTDITSTIQSDDSFRLHHSDSTYPFGLWLIDDDYAGVAVFEDHGISCFLINSNPNALTWATEMYESAKADSCMTLAEPDR